MQRTVRSRLGVTIAAAWLAISGIGSGEPSATTRNGRFDVVTYNVAGLPEGLSKVHPVVNLPLIGARLNQYDVVLIQEDYAYPELLRARLRLPYRSVAFVRGEAMHFGDGLSLFSKFPLDDVKRTPWSSCHGTFGSNFDCWTPKGLAVSRLEVTPGVFVDIYNVHLDAGSAQGDVRARSAQLSQLVEVIRTSSAEQAVVLGGDFNFGSDELPQFKTLLSSIGLADACDRLRCGHGSLFDRVLFRGGRSLRLHPRRWRLGAAFVDARGQALSDHAPVVVRFDWSVRPP